MRALVTLLPLVILTVGLLGACTPSAPKDSTPQVDANSAQTKLGGNPTPETVPAEPAGGSPLELGADADAELQDPAAIAAAKAGPLTISLRAPQGSLGIIPVKPGDGVALTAVVCNRSGQPMTDIKIKMVLGDLATNDDPSWAEFKEIGLTVNPSTDDCKTNTVEVSIPITISTTALQPGVKGNLSPTIVFDQGGNIGTAQAEFVLEVNA